MKVKELKDRLNKIDNEQILNKEINLVLEDDDLIDIILEWYIGKPSENYDDVNPDTEEYKKRNKAYAEVCNMLQGRLTNIELRTDLFYRDGDSSLFFVSEF